jgi:hypothetical protein
MNIMEWLEPTIKERINIAIANADKDYRILTTRFQFLECYKELKYSIPLELQESLKVIDETKDNLFKIAIELAYKSGFRDALEFGDQIKK